MVQCLDATDGIGSADLSATIAVYRGSRIYTLFHHGSRWGGTLYVVTDTGGYAAGSCSAIHALPENALRTLIRRFPEPEDMPGS